MADQFFIMPAADMARYDKIKFKMSTKVTKAPHNVRWEIQPMKLKDRPEFGIPVSVLDHPAFKTLKGRLQTYAIETLIRTDFEYSDLEVGP